MGTQLHEIAEGSRVILHISNETNNMDMGAVVVKHVNKGITIIQLEFADKRTLIFDNVQVNLEYHPPGDIPIIWHNVKVARFKSDYVLKTLSEGIRHNRRNSFRIPIAKTALLRKAGRSAPYVKIKDLSVSGFSISDRSSELDLRVGEQISVSFEDLGYQLDLDGRVVRIEEREDMTVYGLVICNLCKNLPVYVNTKQVYNRQQK